MDKHEFIGRIEREPENDRPDKKIAIDELCCGPVDSVHIERMDDGLYWMAIYKDGKRQIVIFHGRGKIYCRTEAE